MKKIICAAVRIDETDKIFLGHRHCHCNDAANGELSWSMNRQEISKLETTEGFMTSENRFVDRKEAWKIAEAAGQIKQQSGGHGTLYSEDLY